MRALVELVATTMDVSAASLLAMGVRASDDDLAHYPKILRYEEDYRYLSNPTKNTDLWDPIKHVVLSDDSAIYASFGGEWRERFEYLTGGLVPRAPDEALLHRLLLSADLHAGDNLRTFVQLGLHGVTGRDVGPFPTDIDILDLQQGFLDIASDPSPMSLFTLRGGRQEMTFGSSRFVSIREGPNVRRSFDGVWSMYRSDGLDIDLFATRPVSIGSGAFDDVPDPYQAFWGAYIVDRLTSGFNADLYYFGFANERAVYAVGAGREDRQTVGARLWGRLGAFDYNIEGADQFGRFSDLDIHAYGIANDVGWSIPSLPFSPRIGIKGNIESGDKNRSDGRLGTFNPLFPSYAYFSEAPLGAPINDMDVQPNVTLRLAPRLTLTSSYDRFWRRNLADAVYNAALRPVRGSSAGGRYVGDLMTTHLRWQRDRHVEINLDYTHFSPSNSLQLNGGRQVDFAMASVAYRF